MNMLKLGYKLLDIETDSLTPTVVWCIVEKDFQTNEVKVYSDITVWRKWDGFLKDFKVISGYTYVAHNGLSFDFPVLTKFLGVEFEDVIDTFVISRLVNYTNYNTHRLDEIGASLGKRKTIFKDFSKATQEMIDYCVDDVELLGKIFYKYKRFVEDPTWAKAIVVEQGISKINLEMSQNGFKLDIHKCTELLYQVSKEMAGLEATFQKAFPPVLKEVNRIQFRIKADGLPFKSVQEAYEKYPSCIIDGDFLSCGDFVPFNPGSPKDRIEKLWESGWKPFEKTKTHSEFSRKAAIGKKWRSTTLNKELYQEKKEYFSYYGWTVSENNLATLPEDAPDGAKNLAKWLTLEGRRSTLQEWIDCVGEDGRLHGKFWHIGAWTHRMSHSNPNSANIFSPFSGEIKSAVDEVKAKYDADCRALWCVDDGVHLVGTDADGIQLRILAHYLKSDDYVHAIVTGDKKLGTDIHSLNLRALNLEGRTRDNAKTFIYAWLLGAGVGKVGAILSCTQTEARDSVSNFIANTHGLAELKSGLIVRDARRGYFDGFDGRKVLCDSEYLMLAGYLQNGESVIMKHANVLWQKWAKEEKINFKQVNFVHDEWQTECHGSLDMAHRLGELQRNAIEQVGKDLNIYCPLAGSTDIGKNWMETH